LPISVSSQPRQLTSNLKICFKLMSYEVSPWHGKCTLPFALEVKGKGLGRCLVAKACLWVSCIGTKGGFF
jgi:hypothetical protein